MLSLTCVGPTFGDETISDEVFRGADTVVHLADVAGNAGCLSEPHQDVLSDNLLIDSNTISAAKRNGVSRFLYVSAACTHTVRSQKRTRASHSPGRTSRYADHASYQQSKLLGEVQAEHARSDMFHVGILRLHEVYGPGAYSDRLPAQHVSSMMRNALMSPSEGLDSLLDDHPAQPGICQ